MPLIPTEQLGLNTLNFVISAKDREDSETYFQQILPNIP